MNNGIGTGGREGDPEAQGQEGEEGQEEEEQVTGMLMQYLYTQVKELEEEFNKNPHWTNEDVDKISKRLGLDKAKVYKWNWDQKKKLNILPSKVYVYNVPDGSLGNTKQIYVKSAQELLELQNQQPNSNQ